MKVLFLVPPYRTTDALNIVRYPMPYGPVILSTILRGAGHEVTLKDFLLPNLCTSTPAPESFAGKKGPRYAHFGTPLDECLEWIDAHLSFFDVVCLDMCQCNVWEAGAEIAKHIKKAGVPLVVGGPFATTSPDEVAELTGADIICVGEGEGVVVELVERAVRGEKGVFKGSDDGHILDLETIPVPDWDFAPPRDYPAMGGKIRGVLCVSRGCPWLCTFCSVHTIMGRKHRRLPHTRIVLELEEMIRQGVEYVCFLDDNLFISPAAIDDVLGAIDECKRRHPAWGKKAKFYAEEGMEVRIAAIPGVARRIKDAGFQLITLGMETYNDTRKDEAKKPYTREQLVAAAENCKEAGFVPRAFYIVGLPGDTVESVARDLIGFAKLGIEARTNNLKLYPGTDATQFFRDKGLLDDYDWRLSSHYTPDLPEMPYKDVRVLRGYLKGISSAPADHGINIVLDPIDEIMGKFVASKYRMELIGEPGTPLSVKITGNMFRAGPIAHMAELVCLRLGASGAKVKREETSVTAHPVSAPIHPIQKAVLSALVEHGVVENPPEVIPEALVVQKKGGKAMGRQAIVSGRYSLSGGILKKVRAW
jgi:hypothetical protein